MTTAPKAPKNHRRIILKSILGTASFPVGGLSQILAFAQAPALITSDKVRPQSPSGIQSGDITSDGGIVWY